MQKDKILEVQRQKASFNQLQLSYLIHGNKDKFNQFQKLNSLVAHDPIMKFDPSFLHKSRADMMKTFAQKILRYHSIFPLDGSNEVHKINVFLHGTPLSLHGLMFLTTLKNLCDSQQEKQFLQPALRGQIIGCYAQTQLAHGSDVQNLLTTATYDPSSETFLMNTPQIGAAKWWIGDLGVYCSHAAIFAQLIINGKRHGVHAFLVPIRDRKTLEPLRGVEVGDVGPKHGFQNKDNGYLILHNVRIPRRNMLMKYHVVSKEGNYSLQGDQKISYATMLLTRSNLCFVLAHHTTKMTTIATRYSLLRTQFKNSNGQQIPVLDYQTQQEKVIPRIAQSYAAFISSNMIAELGNLVFQQSKQGKFTLLNQAHILASGIKAILSYDTLRGGEILRRSAGGHGFHYYNGIVPLIVQSTPVFTLQGEFTVLMIQVGRFLVKSFSNLMKGKALGSSVQYFKQLAEKNQPIVNLTMENLSCPYFIHQILKIHTFESVKALSTKFANLLGQLKAQEIENHYVGILMNEAAIAHTYATIYSFFLKKVQSAQNPQVKKVLTLLLSLYGIEKIYQRSARYYQTSTINPEGFKLISNKRELLFEQLRPECLSLIEAFGYDDNALMSAIGRSDGKPYQTLIEWAEKYNPLNKKQQREQIVKVIHEAKSLLKPRL